MKMAGPECNSLGDCGMLASRNSGLICSAYIRASRVRPGDELLKVLKIGWSSSCQKSIDDEIEMAI